VGDVAYTKNGCIHRIEEIKSPKDFLQSIYSGHLQEQLARMRASTPVGMGLGLIVFVDPTWSETNFKMLATILVRQSNHPTQPIAVVPICNLAMLGCYFARTLEALQQAIEAPAFPTQPAGIQPSELVHTAKKKHITDGRGLYLHMLQGVRGISKERARKIAAIAPSPARLKHMLHTNHKELSSLITKPARVMLESYLFE
jgi:hypothetical protein